MSIALRDNSLCLTLPQRCSLPEFQPVKAPIFPKGWRGWIARFAWQFVKHLSTEISRENFEYTELRIDKSKYKEAISRVLFKIRDVDRREMKYLVVGRDAFFHIQREMDDLDVMLQFSVSGDYWERDRRGDRIFFLGLQVIVVPWLQGIALLPELDSRRE